MHFSEISFSNNLETLKFKNFSFRANYVGASRGIIKQANSLPDSNFENWQLCWRTSLTVAKSYFSLDVP